MRTAQEAKEVERKQDAVRDEMCDRCMAPTLVVSACVLIAILDAVASSAKRAKSCSGR